MLVDHCLMWIYSIMETLSVLKIIDIVVKLSAANCEYYLILDNRNFENFLCWGTSEIPDMQTQFAVF